MDARRQVAFFYALLGCLIAAHIALWRTAHTVEERWLNVPPAPSENSIAALGLGDRQLAFRGSGIMLQNLGDADGVARGFKDYDYDRLGKWFNLMDKLDSEVPLHARPCRLLFRRNPEQEAIARGD